MGCFEWLLHASWLSHLFFVGIHKETTGEKEYFWVRNKWETQKVWRSLLKRPILLGNVKHI